jgi:hypothetical protein
MGRLPAVSWSAMAVLNANLVAARTRAAAQLLDSPELLAIYESVGGLAADLSKIRDAGLEVEAQNLAQSEMKGAAVAATKEVLQFFNALQDEYVAIIAVVPAVRQDLADAGAVDQEVLVAIDRILLNEATVVMATKIQDDGTTKRKASSSAKREAQRAEIGKDAQALLNLLPVHEALKQRKVTVARLKKLADGAAQLSGKLAKRTTKKGAGKKRTAAKKEAMNKQRTLWMACNRIFKQAAQVDARVAALLDDVTQAGRKKSTDARSKNDEPKSE